MFLMCLVSGLVLSFFERSLNQWSHQHLYVWFWKPTGVGQLCGHPQRKCPHNCWAIAFLCLTTNSSFSHHFFPSRRLGLVIWQCWITVSVCLILTASQKFPLCKFSNTDPFALVCERVQLLASLFDEFIIIRQGGSSDILINDIFMIFYETLTSESIRLMDYGLCGAFSVLWMLTKK